MRMMIAVRGAAMENITVKKGMAIALMTMIVKIQVGSNVVTIIAQIRPIFQEIFSPIIQKQINTAPQTTVVIVHATNDTTSVDTTKLVVSQMKTVRQVCIVTKTITIHRAVKT